MLAHHQPQQGDAMDVSRGFALVPDIASTADCDELCAMVPDVPSRSGRRDLLANHRLADAVQAILLPVAEQVLGAGSLAVGAIWFDKRPARNWKVGWHQDLSVPATGEPSEVVMKDGIPHIQPAEDILSALLIARLHLDPSNLHTGGLAVVPGSHLRGRIAESAIAAVARELGVEHPECPTGSVLLMRPLLLHSSSASEQPVSRRVLQVLFAPRELAGFPWFDRCA
jgi:ectoine hydroxylase-related dioxygenase (phytanoyl-CoA dioxygenase family)